MDAFETHLQAFNSTIHGPEMRTELYNCFYLLKVEIEFYSQRIQEISSKITELEGG